ncbi:hypothetical protein SAMN04487981_101482 [Streptomyces sp. cf386]|nr:hypothetical protein SAMN04487981_101482 [Streptomyces sp. cf386]
MCRPPPYARRGRYGPGCPGLCVPAPDRAGMSAAVTPAPRPPGSPSTHSSTPSPRPGSPEIRASGVAVTLFVHEHKRLGRGIELAMLAEELKASEVGPDFLTGELKGSYDGRHRGTRGALASRGTPVGPADLRRCRLRRSLPRRRAGGVSPGALPRSRQLIRDGSRLYMNWSSSEACGQSPVPSRASWPCCSRSAVSAQTSIRWPPAQTARRSGQRRRGGGRRREARQPGRADNLVDHEVSRRRRQDRWVGR